MLDFRRRFKQRTVIIFQILIYIFLSVEIKKLSVLRAHNKIGRWLSLLCFYLMSNFVFSVKAIRKVYTFNGRTLKTISESEVKIDWIKSEANRLEITFKDVIECPCKVSID